MTVNGLDVKFYGVVDSFRNNGVIKCEEAFAMWRQDVYGFKDILDNLGVGVGDALRFGVHVNAKGMPQVSMPAWKCDENGEPINGRGAAFAKAEEVLQHNPGLLERLKLDIEESSRRGKGKKRGSPDGGKGWPEPKGAKTKGGPAGGKSGKGKPKGKRDEGLGVGAPAAVVNQSALRALATNAKESPLSSVICTREYTISCDLPSDKVEYMKGIADEYLVEVQEKTGCSKLIFEEVEEDLHRLEICGPLLALYQAHAIMMTKYHEACGPQDPNANEGDGGDGGDMPEGHEENGNWAVKHEHDEWAVKHEPDEWAVKDEWGGKQEDEANNGHSPADIESLKAQIRELKRKIRGAGVEPIKGLGNKGKGQFAGGKGAVPGKRK